MGARRWAFRLAGVLWLALGLLLVLTVFGPILGIGLWYAISVRHSVRAARVGTVLGLCLFLVGQLVLDVAGCRHGACTIEPYLIAYAVPLLVTTLNLRAGWGHLPGLGEIRALLGR